MQPNTKPQKGLNENIESIKEALSSLKDYHKNTSIFYRGHFIGLFIMAEQLIDCIIAVYISGDIEDEKSVLSMAIMDFIKIDHKLLALNYILNKHYKDILSNVGGYKYLKSVNGKNDFIVILRNANGVRNTFAHRITDTLELSASIPLIIKKRTGLRGNGDDSTELIEYRNTRTFSLPELKEYTKELTSIIYTLIELCKELQIK